MSIYNSSYKMVQNDNTYFKRVLLRKLSFDNLRITQRQRTVFAMWGILWFICPRVFFHCISDVVSVSMFSLLMHCIDLYFGANFTAYRSAYLWVPDFNKNSESNETKFSLQVFSQKFNKAIKDICGNPRVTVFFRKYWSLGSLFWKKI